MHGDIQFLVIPNQTHDHLIMPDVMARDNTWGDVSG
jgi:hypothetical protein